MSSLRDQAARRRMELNPLTTSLQVAFPPPHQTPSSAISTLSAQFGYNPQVYTPQSAVRQYNPQQWIASPNVTPDSGGLFASHALAQHPQQAQDREVVVTPAPPPYSPPRSDRNSVTLVDEPTSAGSPAARISPAPAHTYRASPEPISNPVFPPPPPASSRNRSSGDRQPMFSMSSFSRRPAPAPVPAPAPAPAPASEAPRLSPELNRDHGPSLRRPGPIAAEAPYLEAHQSQLAEPRAPASRRAASTGAISTPSSSRSRGSSTARWEPGMPLPPPPPGPPPAPSSRSQSMTPTDRIVSPPTRRPAHSSSQASSLGPVPPTPAGWVDEDAPGRGRLPTPGLSIDTSSVGSSTVTESNSGSSSSGLARTHATRGEPKSIRERRNESKTRRATEEPSNNPWAEAITPSDIVVPTASGLTRRQTITRSTPRSARSHYVEPALSTDASNHNTPVQATPPVHMQGSGSRGSTPTPRPLASASQLETPTPPFSPNQGKMVFLEGSPAIPPKALPTPPPQSKITHESPARLTPHAIHSPINENVPVAPLQLSRPTSRQSSASRLPRSTPDQFARSAVERHQAFVQKEAAAATDDERVRIFAEFIVSESRLRRDLYSGAINAMGSEILELTRDLFRPSDKSRRESNVSRSSAWTPDSSSGPMSPDVGSHRGSILAALKDGPQMQSEPLSGSGPTSPAVHGRPETTWWTGYMPSLSPIPSMSVSEAPDGSDSRGRPSSRWWEVSQEGSSGTPGMSMGRSKRESKYMGMPRELRESLQYDNTPGSMTNGRGVGAAGPSEQSSYGPNEYPAEKVGHDHNPSSPPAPQSARSQPTFSPAPLTPNPNHLDVSRLVTLPPPYPRHHPAVNNNHPDLTSIRTTVRTLSDFSEVDATKARFSTASKQIKEDLEAAATKRRDSLRANIQREIGAGTMNYTDAARIESDSAASEAEKTKEASKIDFDHFQTQVVGPVNDLLMDRVTKATELFEQLRSKLFVDAQEANPNLTQEEGDEQPELLEKLTLLKWIFEAREQLHRELFDLLSDRNDRYRDMVIMPYKLANNADKVAHAQRFFAEDASKRKLAFEQEVLKRTEEFMDIIEQNVVRGVEVQLSAFWDIAPPLSRITDKIPASSLHGFNIQIPFAEYEENPSYYDFPMQYLYSLIAHCEKSSYQFIESQINLLCLLHEVKLGVTIANCKLMRSQRVAQGESEGEVDAELKEVEADEESRLTDDLKEKVRCVEELWGSALGSELKRVKEKIVGFLVELGGWEELSEG